MHPSGEHPKLLLITHEFHPHRGGIAVYSAEMAAAARTLGYDVEVWAPALAAGTSEPDWPFRVRRLALAGTHGLTSQWRMIQAIHKARHGLRGATLYLPEPGPILAMLCLQFFGIPWGTRLILTLHGSEILRLHQRPLIRLATSRLFAQSHRIGVVSRHTQNLLIDRFPSAANKVCLTPGAVRRASLAPAHAVVRPAATDGPVVILTVARLHPRKGQLRIIEALAHLPPATRARIEYWIAGAHGKENYDRSLHEAAGRADFPVKFLGDLTDGQLAEVYAQADIFAMTSMPHKLSVEGFGLVYLEAGAHGLPVIAHAIGGVPEAVLDGQTGLLVAPDRPTALTAAFARLIDDPELRRRLGEAGRIHAQDHSWRESAESLFGNPAHAVPISRA